MKSSIILDQSQLWSKYLILAGKGILSELTDDHITAPVVLQMLCIIFRVS